MRQLPNITGVVGNWSFNRTLVDSSGNLPVLESLDQTLETVLAPTYVQFDDCTWGVDTTYAAGVGSPDNKSKLKLEPANAAPLRFSGPFTFQWTGIQRGTYGGISYFCCVDPGITPNRNGAADRIGSLYSIHSNGGDAAISDQSIGSTLPTPGYGEVGTNLTWATAPPTPPPFAAPAAFAVTRDVSGNYHFYRAGVLIGSVASAGSHTVLGNEAFYIGGTEIGVPLTGLYGGTGGFQFANLRILNYERQPADIAADSNFAISPCANREPFTPGAGSTGGAAAGLPIIGAAATGHHFRYVPKAFGDQFRNPGEGS